MSTQNKITFISNPALQDSGDRYLTVSINIAAALKSWRGSVFSFEGLRPDGGLKAINELSESEQSRRAAVEEKLSRGEPVAQPVLGIGIMDNIEIGMGRAEFLTAAARGLKSMPVHILRSNESDFKPFLADVN